MPHRLRFRLLLALLSLTLLADCSVPVLVHQPPGPPEPPVAPHEFRAAWVATVNNIDWPSQRGLPAARQRAEIIAILDCAQSLHLNAIIFQVRPAADALYPSALEPWSEYLTGVQGRDPGYDPLAVWIAEAHRRGLELHAWFNPYRARHQEARSPLAPGHIARVHPEAVKPYGDLLWMDPGEPAAARQMLAVVRDVVHRYDVDGVQLDDYFYPYPFRPPGAKPDQPDVDFPDGPAWRRYQASGGKLSRPEWRRQNVNDLISQLSVLVHQEKPWVKFGISPFGVGRPDLRPPGIAGLSQYDKLYADVELWLARGWLDYVVPQLYWPSNRPAQDFRTLLSYWAGQNLSGHHLWAGLNASAVNSTPSSWLPGEILHQIDSARAQAGADGQMLFSMIALLQDRRGLATALRTGPYAQAALVPASPWLGREAPGAPGLERVGPSQVSIHPAVGHSAARFAVWRHQGSGWQFSVQPGDDPVINLGDGTDALVVSAVDRLGNESARVRWPAAARSQK